MRLGERLGSIGEADSLNWRTHIIFGIPAVLSALLFDFDRLGGAPGLWIGLATVGFAVTVISIELMSLALRKRDWKKRHPLVVLGVLILAGLIRGLTIYELGLLLELIPADDLSYRLTGGPIFVVSLYFIANLLVSSFLDHREQLKRLESQKSQLVRIREGFEQQLRRLDDAQRARIRELVAPSIWELQKHLSPENTNVQNAIFELKSLNEEVVRPLSHQYSRPQQSTEPETSNSEQPGDSRPRGIPARISIHDSLDPTFFLLTTLLISFSAQNVVLGFFGALTVAALVVTIVMAMFLLLRAISNGRVFRTTTAISITVYAGALIGFIAGWVAQLLGLAATTFFPVQVALFVSINMLFTLLIGSLQVERDRSLQELTKTNEDLKVLNSLLRQRAWLSGKSLAMELHGPIQGTLQSVAAKLAKTKHPTDKELSAALAQIREAFDKVGTQDYLAGKSLESLLEDLILLWEGALDVQIELDPEAKESLDKDPAAARVVLELCREATTNAVKHGQAEQVKIQIFQDQEFLVFTAFNDGISMTEENKGRGLELYQEVSHSFALSNVEGGVKLNLLLPISQ